jgi:hypothetical protein
MPGGRAKLQDGTSADEDLKSLELWNKQQKSSLLQGNIITRVNKIS